MSEHPWKMWEVNSHHDLIRGPEELSQQAFDSNMRTFRDHTQKWTERLEQNRGLSWLLIVDEPTMAVAALVDLDRLQAVCVWAYRKES